MYLALEPNVIVELFKDNFDASKSRIQIAWNHEKIVVARRMLGFCVTLGTVFITALLLARAPEKLPLWYTVNWLYHTPLRVVNSYRRGHHYFYAELCHWVNLSVNNSYNMSK
jgi:Protein of unknown function (DUF2838)